jgi:hypothetical protein
MSMLRAVMLALLLGLAFVASPVATAQAGEAGPSFPKAQGSCVDDPATMRRHHFDFLTHQRDDTLRAGIRGAKYSLKECVTCHASTAANGKPVPVNAPGQFCQSCHAYAAVTIDCFSCHATTPQTAEAKP